ncbi:MAG TPA: hypothetical protein VFS08_15195 [Gemmatimonadaceae bacterium]|nr:hypothetical protein [Gemmatimonadaceae bacterium]
MLLLLLQLVAATPAPDSAATYATPVLREFVAAAAVANRRVPASLLGYDAAVESEVALLGRRGDEAEVAASLEQLASRVRWRRDGAFEQRVVGYRAQTAGFNVSMLSAFDQGWVIPVLYGNRMALFFGRDTTRGRGGGGLRGRRARDDSVLAVHPFAEDREAVYRFTGGDTVATIRLRGRDIPIVRVHVEPRARLPERTFVFRGDVDVDAVRHQIVRLRGQFLVTGPPPSLRDRLLRQAVQPLAFAELVSQEIAARYWLPSYQRVELQVTSPLLGDLQATMRIVSRFHDVAVDEAPDAGAATLAGGRAGGADSAAGGTAAGTWPVPDTRPAAPGDTMVPHAHRLVVAARDTLAAFDAWRQPLGAATAEARDDDFLDVAPPRLRPTGPPIVEPYVERLSDAIRFDRVQGVFTGVGARVRLRDRLPGAMLLATGGWAWAERTARGRVRGDWRRGAWTWSVGAGRTLDLTNDFRAVYDSGSTVAALLGRDDYDYVDRRWAMLGLHGEPTPGWRLRLDVGPARDAAVVPHVSRGLVHGDEPFRANRGARAGGYWRTIARAEWNPDVRAGFVRPGIGGRVRWERGDGGLSYDRVEARLDARTIRGDWTGALHAEAGAVLGRPLPPQQLFELGGGEWLGGYDYKEFAGDRAAVVGALGMYTLALWRAPLRVRVPGWRAVYLPAPAPALSLGLDGGWAGVSGDAAREAVRALGVRTNDATGEPVPLSRPSGRIRLSVDLRLRLFGGGVSAGVARALERGAAWRVVFGLGS